MLSNKLTHLVTTVAGKPLPTLPRAPVKDLVQQQRAAVSPNFPQDIWGHILTFMPKSEILATSLLNQRVHQHTLRYITVQTSSLLPSSLTRPVVGRAVKFSLQEAERLHYLVQQRCLATKVRKFTQNSFWSVVAVKVGGGLAHLKPWCLSLGALSLFLGSYALAPFYLPVYLPQVAFSLALGASLVGLTAGLAIIYALGSYGARMLFRGFYSGAVKLGNLGLAVVIKVYTSCQELTLPKMSQDPALLLRYYFRNGYLPIPRLLQGLNKLLHQAVEDEDWSLVLFLAEHHLPLSLPLRLAGEPEPCSVATRLLRAQGKFFNERAACLLSILLEMESSSARLKLLKEILTAKDSKELLPKLLTSYYQPAFKAGEEASFYDGYTLLHFACKLGDSDLVAALLALGAHPDQFSLPQRGRPLTARALIWQKHGLLDRALKESLLSLIASYYPATVVS